MLAPGVQRRRDGQVFSFEQAEIEDANGPQVGETATDDVGRQEAMGLGVWCTGVRHRILAYPSARPSLGVDGKWFKRKSKNTSGDGGRGLLPAGRLGRYNPSHRAIETHDIKNFQVQESNENQKGGQKEESRRRQSGAGQIQVEEQRGRQEGPQHAAEVLWLEQWKWSLLGAAAWATVLVKDPTAPQVHSVRLPWPPVSILSEREEESVKRHGGEGTSSRRSRTPRRNRGGKSIKVKGNSGDAEAPQQAFDPEDLKSRRVRLRVISVEKASGSGDLLQDKPYKDHLTWAQRGRIDGYHAGFPRSRFSRLRHRREPGPPPPVRTKAEPYGMKVNTRAQQEECDRGTVMASRSITMAKLVANRKRGGRIRAIATLENPPPSSLEDHLLAWQLGQLDDCTWRRVFVLRGYVAFYSTTTWELPEMQEFLDYQLVQAANFDTCIYQSNVPVGYRNIKPQQFSGSMLGIKELEGRCKCGEGARHEPIIGRERSRASGTYPDELCDKHARCVITVLMGKEEFLRYKEMRLKETIMEHKAKAEKASSSSEEKASQRSLPAKAESAHKEKRTKTEASESPDFDPSTSSTSSCSAGEDEGGDERKGESLQPETVHTWVGGDGKFGMLKSRNINIAAEDATYVGGMRDPYKAAQANPNLMSMGLRIRAAWETFVKQFPNGEGG